MARCSSCFLECSPQKDSVMCTVCGLWFHIQCTTWKIILNPREFETRLWRCIFCKSGRVKKFLFLENYSCQDIGVLLNLKLTEKWSVRRFYRKSQVCHKTLAQSTVCSEASIKYFKDFKAA